MQTKEHFDVLIVGAGLSGIGAGCHLTKECPGKTFAILESRKTSGGTWDLFRYPGIRSDSDMYTLGYEFKTWTSEDGIAEGGDILNYIREAAKEHNVESKIRYEHKVIKANWDTNQALWLVDVVIGETGEVAQYTCKFFHTCCGYYNYEKGFTPDFPGVNQFKGEVIHPQLWPEELDYEDKKVVVIGSGATAVTLVPAMSEKAEKVTMLQRSPTYIIPLPKKNPLALKLFKFLPDKIAYSMTRVANVLLSMYLYSRSRNKPEKVRSMIRHITNKYVGEKVDVDVHFKPKYEPWDERLCVIPDGDLFKAIRKDKAHIETDHIETFTENGIQLKSGKHLDADIIVTATGLELQLLGGMELYIDGKPVEFTEKVGYKGMMFNDIPNMSIVFGYTNASWTLKADLINKYLCRLIKYMDKNDYDYCMPVINDPDVKAVPFLDLKSGYVMRAKDKLPKQGSKGPWKLNQNYFTDKFQLQVKTITDDSMLFVRKKPVEKEESVLLEKTA